MRLPGDASQQQQLTCSFPFWYPLFEKVALNSIHLPLPPDFVSFLIADGVYLGDSSRAVSVQPSLASRFLYRLA
jgi:hypothetical protein